MVVVCSPRRSVTSLCIVLLCISLPAMVVEHFFQIFTSNFHSFFHLLIGWVIWSLYRLYVLAPVKWVVGKCFIPFHRLSLHPADVSFACRSLFGFLMLAITLWAIRESFPKSPCPCLCFKELKFNFTESFQSSVALIGQVGGICWKQSWAMFNTGVT